MSKIIRSAFILINVSLACFTLFSYISPIVDPNITYVFSFFGLLYPFLLVLNILFIAIWLFTKKRYALISLVTILLGYGHMDSFIGFNKEAVSADNNTIKVITYNLQSVNQLQKHNGSFKEDVKKRFISDMKEHGLPTIFCTQETTYKGHTLIKESLGYPYMHKGDQDGTAILSKAPFLATGVIDLKSDEASSAIWADILYKNDTLRVYSIHLRSNKISKPASKMLQDGDLQSPKTWNNARDILANYKNSTIIRVNQARTVINHTSASPYKTIVCGDFNDTPLSHVYKVIAKDKKDSFKQAGSGIGTTYAGVIPALRIDYILADERLDIISHQIHKGNYSDHYPISAKIVLP